MTDKLMLVFDDGNFSESETVLLSDSMAHLPREVLSESFGIAEPCNPRSYSYRYELLDRGDKVRRREVRVGNRVGLHGQGCMVPGKVSAAPGKNE